MIAWLPIGFAGGMFVIAAFTVWENGNLREDLERSRSANAQCAAVLAAMNEGQEIDDAIPDDLGGFDIPDAWRLHLAE